MSTTVTYKGQTLGTVENETKTLDVKGFYCEDDITLTDVSGGVVKLLRHEEITPTTTLTNNNKMTVSLDVADACAILVTIDEYPSAPDPSYYIALYWSIFAYQNGNGGTTGNAILRPNGTIGTDGYMCSYNKSSGVLTIGGQYGYFFAGTKYHIYQFEITV